MRIDRGMYYIDIIKEMNEEIEELKEEVNRLNRCINSMLHSPDGMCSIEAFREETPERSE